MDQDTTWYGGRPQKGDIVLDGDPGPPHKRGTIAPLFDPLLLSPNGRMDQHVT